jgi:molecular chaperone DnaJ
MVAHERDHYAVLGVAREASHEEIKKAFRQMARRLHPDTAPPRGSEAFYEVVAAYEVLSNPKRRRLYDRLGLGPRRRRPARPAPAAPPIELTLEWYEAQRGASKPVTLAESVACDGCDGRGYERGVTLGVCVQCRGSGHLNKVSESETLRYLEVESCSACGGRGHEAPPPCTTCRGTGGRMEQQTFRVRTPAGVRDGDVLTVDGLDQRFLLRVGSRPRDSKAVLLVAGAALLCAVAMLLFLLLR